MKKLMALLILLIPNLSQAEDAELLIGEYTSKQSLFLFREIQGLDLTISEKQKSATISASHDFGTGNFLTAKITGKFDGTDTSFATEEGLVNDVTLNISYTKLIYEASNSGAANFSALANNTMTLLRNNYLNCMRRFLTLPENRMEALKTITKLKKSDEAKFLYLVAEKCSSQYQAVLKQDRDVSNFEFARSYWFIKNEVTYSPGSFKYYDTRAC